MREPTPRRCPRCRGHIIRDGYFEPYCLACGWCWWTRAQLHRSRVAYLIDRIIELRPGPRAHPMAYASVERVR